MTNMTSTPFRTIIVEDEALARARLRKHLANHTNLITVIGEADNGEDGLQLINSEKPDLIFLDIQMPVMTGFEMLRSLDHMPKIIFTTAYEEYAIKAFEENSVDYLLKPIRAERLEKALDKLQQMAGASTQAVDFSNLLQQLNQVKQAPAFTSITITSGDRIIPIPLENVAFFHAEDKYVFLHDFHGKKYIVDYTLSALQEKLPDQFTRVHRAHIINRDKVLEIRKGFNGRFVFRMINPDKTRIESGTSYSSKIREVLGL